MTWTVVEPIVSCVLVLNETTNAAERCGISARGIIWGSRAPLFVSVPCLSPMDGHGVRIPTVRFKAKGEAERRGDGAQPYTSVYKTRIECQKMEMEATQFP